MREACGGGDDAIEGDSRSIGGDAVEGLGPPFVGGYAKPWDRGGIVGELLNLFLKGEGGDEGSSSGGDGEGGVAEKVGAVVGWLAREFRVWVGDGDGGYQEF